MVSFPPFSVEKSFDVSVEAIGPMQLLGDGSLVFSSEKQGQCKLKQYNLRTGAEKKCVDVPEVCRLCPVELQGRSSLAVSFA